MKLAHAVLAILLAGLLLAAVNTAHAQWSALSSGYAVTTNWHGEPVPLGESVTAWAGTTDSDVEEVLFRWKYPNETIFAEVTVSISGPYETSTVPGGVPQEIISWAEEHQGINVWYASNTQIPDTYGDWCVQVFFKGEGGRPKADVNATIAMRATSFNTIPDFPVVGTAGALMTMLLVFGLFWRKKKNNTLI